MTYLQQDEHSTNREGDRFRAWRGVSAAAAMQAATDAPFLTKTPVQIPHTSPNDSSIGARLDTGGGGSGLSSSMAVAAGGGVGTGAGGAGAVTGEDGLLAVRVF